MVFSTKERRKFCACGNSNAAQAIIHTIARKVIALLAMLGDRV
jgi:hypothetical protein